MATQDKTAAEIRLQAGIDAYNDGKLEAAADAFVAAEKLGKWVTSNALEIAVQCSLTYNARII